MKDSEPKSEQTKALEQKAIDLYKRIYNKPVDTRTIEEVVLLSLPTDRAMEFMGDDIITSDDFRSLVSIVFSEGRTLHRSLVPGVAFTRYFQLKELGPFRILVEREGIWCSI